MSRKSPVVEVSPEDLAEYTDVQIGHRVLAALAHTPAEREYGSYHAICVASDADTCQMTSEDVLEAQYDTILNWTVGSSDERRAMVGEKVRDALGEQNTFILGRS